VISETTTVVKKNIISRLFTSFDPEPDLVDRKGFGVYYTWNRAVNPGEELNIVIKTNWLFPFLLIILIIAVVIIVKQYTTSGLIVGKKVNFVRTKGGEFALKVSVILTSKKYVERILLVDRLPALVKIHESFKGEQPSKVDEKNRRIEWNIENLEPGERRIVSYIIYSKIGVLGKFALPPATAVYEENGKIKDSTSNRAFFVGEQRTRDIEEE